MPDSGAPRLFAPHRAARVLALVILLCALSATSTGAAGTDLARNFLSPPDAAWPWVYWIWSDGNMTPEGAVADLQAMRRVGIRGVLIMEVDQGIPQGPVRFLSPRWRELFRVVLREATRLGIQVDMNNDGGWSGSGGPWITPELSMQVVTWSETNVAGPRHLVASLPQPRKLRDYYRDIAVLAFPATGPRMAEASPVIACGSMSPRCDAARLADGNPGTTVTLPAPAKPGDPVLVNIDFERPFSARALTIALDSWYAKIDATLESSADGRTFSTVKTFTAAWPSSSINFDPVSARHYRIAFKAANALTIGEIELHSGGRIEAIPIKAAFMHQRGFPTLPGPQPSAETIPSRARVLNLTSKLTADGRLTWDVPAGRWTILRLGATTTGKANHPAPRESEGLECDKLSKRAVDAHFAGLMGKLVDDQRAVGAQSLTYTHIDSWEVGSQNWTPAFREEFQKRRGYDPMPFFPVVTGRAIESEDVTERFLWDWRRTVADLIIDNYAGHMRDLAHQNGLKLSIEAYGGGPLDPLPYAGRADLPINEFWTGKELYESWVGEEPHQINKEMTSAAHAYGLPVIGSEAFTAVARNGKWMNHPFRLKQLGDTMFTIGVNRFIFHRYAMQPWLDRKPGMTMGPYGIHFDRTNTWFEQSRVWLTYLARCQFLLQQGRFVADVAYMASEKAPNQVPGREALDPSMPWGFDYDAVPPELIAQATVEDNGRVRLPSGMSYRVLVLPTGNTMRPALLGKIKTLVESGATVLGQPPVKSPSLSGYPAVDTEVRRLARQLWGDSDGVSMAEHRLGKGRVVWGRPLGDVLREFTGQPDFVVVGPRTAQTVPFIHRNIDGRDLYFIASPQSEATTFLFAFRVAGKQPELWWPDTGRIERPAIYDSPPGATRIPIRLGPHGSVFVIFSNDPAPPGRSVAAVLRDGLEISGMPAAAPEDLRGKMSEIRVELADPPGSGYTVEAARSGAYEIRTSSGRSLAFEVPTLPKALIVEGPWNVRFPEGWGAPPQATFDRLISWTAHPDPGIKYFSGTAAYHRQIEIPPDMLAAGRKLYLDLGRVQVIAEVSLNGRDLGILWKPPFRVEATAAARPGANDLEIRVVNLWPNRLIGDDHLPEDTERTGPQLSRWPQWLLDGKPSPTGRLTFSTWKHWTKDDPLFESGLLGPVTLEVTQQVELKRTNED
jgi:hypothetical protein